MPRRRPKPQPRRRGRPPSPDSRTIPRMIRLSPAEAAAHDAARGDQPWAEWVRELVAAGDLAAYIAHWLGAHRPIYATPGTLVCRAEGRYLLAHPSTRRRLGGFRDWITGELLAV